MTPGEREYAHPLPAHCCGARSRKLYRFVRQLNELLECKNQRFAEDSGSDNLSSPPLTG
jgi:hypothetical protein